MSTIQTSQDKSYLAGEDLSAFQYGFVKLNAAGEVVKAAAATDKIIGVLQNAPEDEDVATVRSLNGGANSKILVGAAGLANGSYVTTNSAGLAIATTTAGNVVAGYYGGLVAVSGDLVEIMLSNFHHKA